MYSNKRYCTSEGFSAHTSRGRPRPLSEYCCFPLVGWWVHMPGQRLDRPHTLVVKPDALGMPRCLIFSTIVSRRLTKSRDTATVCVDVPLIMKWPSQTGTVEILVSTKFGRYLAHPTPLFRRHFCTWLFIWRFLTLRRQSNNSSHPPNVDGRTHIIAPYARADKGNGRLTYDLCSLSPHPFVSLTLPFDPTTNGTI